MKKSDAVVIFIFLKEAKILIEKRLLKKYPGEQYLVPGGRVKELENLEQALIREIEEELGVIPVEFTQLPIDEDIRGLDGQSLIPFLINKWQGEFPKVILDRGNPLVWLALEEVLTTPVIPTRKIMKALQKYLSKTQSTL